MNGPDPFVAPASGDFTPWDDLEGRLLLFTVHREGEQKTKFDAVSNDGKPMPVIIADMAVLDPPIKGGSTEVPAGTTYESIMIFQRVLCARLRPRIGQMVLARLECERGTAELRAKYGKDAKKWTFSDGFTEADAQLAREWIAENTKDPFSEAATG